jgi:hypothetical protein
VSDFIHYAVIRFSKHHTEQEFHQLFQRHHGECQWRDGKKNSGYEPKDAISRDRRDAHTPYDLQAVAEISKGLDVAAGRRR